MTTQSAAGPSIHPSSSDSPTGIDVTQSAPSGLPASLLDQFNAEIALAQRLVAGSEVAS